MPQITFKAYTPEQLEKLHQTLLTIWQDLDRVCKKHGIRYFAMSGTLLGAVRHGGFIPWDDDLDVALFREDYEKLLSVWEAELGDRYTVFSPETKEKYYNFVPILSKNGTRMIVPLSKDRFDTGIFLDLFIYENIPDDEKQAEKQIRRTYFLRNLYLMGRANFELLYDGAAMVQKCKYAAASFVRFFAKRFDPDGSRIRARYLREIEKYNGKTQTYTVLGDPYARDLILKEEELLPLTALPFEGYEMPVAREYREALRRKFGEDYMLLPPEDKRVNHCPYILEFEKED